MPTHGRLSAARGVPPSGLARPPRSAVTASRGAGCSCTTWVCGRKRHTRVVVLSDGGGQAQAHTEHSRWAVSPAAAVCRMRGPRVTGRADGLFRAPSPAPSQIAATTTFPRRARAASSSSSITPPTMTVITATIPGVGVTEEKRAPRARTGSVSSTDSNVALPSFEALAPSRPPTTRQEEEVAIPVPGGRDVRLKVDAGPGCGGIAWPAGEVRVADLSRRKHRQARLLTPPLLGPHTVHCAPARAGARTPARQDGAGARLGDRARRPRGCHARACRRRLGD